MFKGSSSPADAAATVTRAGGTVVADYSRIGVLVARSDNTAFAERMRADNRVESASPTRDFATKLEPAAVDGAQPGDLPNAPAGDSDTFSSLQWDMRQMHTPEAHAITGGSPAVVILSTWPADKPCTRSRQEPTGDPTYPTAVYCAIQGTSMAGPHVAGLAGLVISRFGDLKNPQNGTMRPSQVEQLITQTADPHACPGTLPDANAGSLGAAGVNYGEITGSQSDAPQECQGNGGHTSWYGQGQADALAAVTDDRANG